jgi:hypothetical protein
MSESYSCARHDGEGVRKDKVPLILKLCIAEYKWTASCPGEIAPVYIE